MFQDTDFWNIYQKRFLTSVKSTYVDCFNGNKPVEDRLILTWTIKASNQKAHSSGPTMLVIMVANEDDYERRDIKVRILKNVQNLL